MHRLYLNLGHDMAVYDRLRKSSIAALRDIADGKTAIGDDGDGPEKVVIRVLDVGPLWLAARCSPLQCFWVQ